MANRCDAALRLDIPQHGIQIERSGTDAIVDKLRYAKHVEVPVERRHLAPGNQQDAIEVGLKLALRVVLRIGVVVGDGNEIQAARRRRLHAEKDRARNHLAALAGATAVAVRRMHVQVAAIPARPSRKRMGRKARILVSRIEADFGAIVCDSLRANIWHRDKQTPLPGRNRARQIGGGGIGLADGEVAFVAAALSAKALRIEYTQIECCALFLAGVLKIHTDAVRTGRDGERDLEIGFVLCARNLAGENQVWRCLLLSPSQRRRKSRTEDQTDSGPSLDGCQVHSFAAPALAWRGSATVSLKRVIPHPRPVRRQMRDGLTFSSKSTFV